MGDGLEAFRRGRFYEARELWEAEGLVVRDPERAWIKGLAEIAAGFLRCDENGLSSAQRLIFKGLHRLAGAPPVVGGIKIADVRHAGAGLLEALRSGQPANPRSLVERAA
jgi:hypothetical protein